MNYYILPSLIGMSILLNAYTGNVHAVIAWATALVIYFTYE